MSFPGNTRIHLSHSHRITPDAPSADLLLFAEKCKSDDLTVLVDRKDRIAGRDSYFGARFTPRQSRGEEEIASYRDNVITR